MDMFLGPTPLWYKQAVIAALVLNVPAYFILGPLVTSWIILAEFIFTLAMALKCFHSSLAVYLGFKLLQWV